MGLEEIQFFLYAEIFGIFLSCFYTFISPQFLSPNNWFFPKKKNHTYNISQTNISLKFSSTEIICYQKKTFIPIYFTTTKHISIKKNFHNFFNASYKLK